MGILALVAPSVERSSVTPADEEPGAPGRRPTVTLRRVLGAAALTVLVALPVAAQVELVSARRALDADRMDQRMARASARAQRSMVSSTERSLTAADADAAVAADEVERSRVLLAASGVEEEAIVSVLEQTQLWLDTVMLQRSDVQARIGQQGLDLPAAKACVLDANRALARGNGPAPPCLVTPPPP
jgi:hypothetical protein